jgi:signal transduction histidine kinase
LNRELRAISNCNQILLRATDEQSLLEQICQIVCEEAGYRMAWVAYAEHDEAKSIRPVASAGAEDGHLVNLGLTWADTERGRSPTGTAIRTGKHCCIQDFGTDPRLAPWREDALQRGFRSGVAFPLKDEQGRVFGALTIFSAEANAFIPNEMALLEELAGDLAYGITALRTRAGRQRAETALQETRTELERVSRVTTMGALTASIAHEVNQPLAGVVTSANAGLNWLAANPPNLSKAKEALERVRRDGTRAGEVITRIRGLLKRTPPAKSILSVNPLIHDVLALLAGELRAHNIETAVTLESDIPSILGDTIQLQQVLLNLITNAIDAMAGVTDGQRTLRLRACVGDLEGRRGVVVAVSDTGMGLGSMEVERLFDAFHTTKPQGMGMGLWISRSIVEEHGGRLTAQNNSGPGATFVIIIPAENQVTL